MKGNGIWLSLKVTNPQVEDHAVKAPGTPALWKLGSWGPQEATRQRVRVRADSMSRTFVSVSAVLRASHTASGKSKGTETSSPGPDTILPIVTLPYLCPRQALWPSPGRTREGVGSVSRCERKHMLQTHESLGSGDSKKRILSQEYWARERVGSPKRWETKIRCDAPEWSLTGTFLEITSIPVLVIIIITIKNKT